MRRILALLSLIFLGVVGSSLAQQSDIHLGTASLTAACTNANTTCDPQNVPNFGPYGSVLGPATLEFNTTGYGLAVITLNGPLTTASGATISFEFSDDGGTSWYQNICTRTDANIQEASEAIPSGTSRAWDCGIGAATRGRVRQSAITSGNTVLSATLTTGLVEPAPTVAVIGAAAPGAAPVGNPALAAGSDGSFVRTLATDNQGHLAVRTDAGFPYSCTITISATGTTQCQVAPAAGTRNYVQSYQIFVNAGGTVNNIALEYGTGASCGTGTTAITPTYSGVTAAPANSPGILVNFSGSGIVTPTANALCATQGGTTGSSITVTINGFVAQ